ncbi:Alpha/Beta hydrolase protein [Tribonema minus]|uniref:Carboxylic ester hydrolase n=1 Tax=Tribonema minus TaxID=303371 RepID=A0A835Z3F7_9STRA|nr:Alpha/Beta hydrolase protein [Tribonema minus]
MRRRGHWLQQPCLSMYAVCHCILMLSRAVAADLRSMLSGKVLVETALGTVVGTNDGSTQSFLGIPYALPPVGDGRWRSPEPVEPWAHKLEAFEFGAECMQSTSRGSHYPVMVWIFGGGFQQGASSHAIYHGNMLAKRDVVVVSLNYRVGALGFMVSVHDGLWGNYGLQDQRLALQWVHDHIENFGGDPDCVTLFGESAGAMSAGLHMHMDGAGTLFHGVIMQSNPLGYKFRSITIANFMGQAVKRGLDCIDLQCMRNEPASEIMHQQEMLLGVPRSVGDFFTWGPVMTDSIHRNLLRRYSRTVQGAVPLMNVTQPLTMWGAATGGTMAEVPVLMGANSHEGQMFVYAAFPVNMPKYVYWGFVLALFKDSAPKVLQQYGEMARQYRGSGDYRPVMSQIIHDYLFRCPLRRTAHLLQDRRDRSENPAGTPPVFVYEFSHPTTVPGFAACNGLACHTAELPYVFEQLEEIRSSYSYASFLARNGTEEAKNGGFQFPGQVDADTKVSRIMAAYWTQFAKGLLDISESPTVHTAVRDCICQFWDELQWRY